MFKGQRTRGADGVNPCPRAGKDLCLSLPPWRQLKAVMPCIIALKTSDVAKSVIGIQRRKVQWNKSNTGNIKACFEWLVGFRCQAGCVMEANSVPALRTFLTHAQDDCNALFQSTLPTMTLCGLMCFM